MPLSDSQQKFMQLADQLEEEDSHKYADVIYNLRCLNYDDFANETFDMPKMQMIADFTELGRMDIVEQVKDGDYDQ